MAKGRSNRKPKSAKTSKFAEILTNAKKRFGDKIKFLSITLLLMFSALLFSFYLNRQGLFNEIGTAILDMQRQSDVPKEKSDVVIVDITDDDFRNLFDSQTRPLKPKKLQELIIAVAEGQPCVIGVDIDTSYPAKYEDFQLPEEYLKKIVWARVTDKTSNETEKPMPLDVLGGKDLRLNEKSGIPLLDKDDSGKSIRRYSRLIETQDGNQPAFAWAIYRESANQKCANITFPNPKADTSPLLIGYSRTAAGFGRTKTPASNVLKLAANENWKNKELIKDKIVLIGGSYAGEDRHETPLGKISGVEINANIIEGELRGANVEPPGFWLTAVLSVCSGLILIAMFDFFHRRTMIWLSLFGVFILPFLGSYLFGYSFAQAITFTLVMFVVFIAEIFDKLRDRLRDYFKSLFKKFYSLSGGRLKEETPSSPPKKKIK